MAQRHRRKILTIEWTWLLVGTGAIASFAAEDWAAPYIPVLWMLGMLGLFLVYRFGVTYYEIHWPEPEEVAYTAPGPDGRRVGGDGIVGTVAYALPQMRGRSIPKNRDQKRAEEVSQIAIPSADGQFEDANLATVFSYVAEDSEPTPALGASDGLLARKVAQAGLFGVTVYEYEELRPETDDDLTGSDLPIPSFAESQLTTLERAKALKLAQRRQREPAMSAAVAAVVQRSQTAPPAARKTVYEGVFGVEVINPEVLKDEFHPGDLAEVTGEMTNTDVSLPGLGGSGLTPEQREKALDEIRGAERPAGGGAQKPTPPRPGAQPRPAAAQPDETDRHVLPDLAPHAQPALPHVAALRGHPAKPGTLPPPISAPPTARRAPTGAIPAVTPPGAPPRDDLKQDALRRDDLKRDNLKRDDLTRDDLKRDDLKLDDLQEDTRDLATPDELDEMTRQRDVPAGLRAPGAARKEGP